MRLIDADKLERDLESLKQDYEDEGCDSKRIDGIDDCVEEIRCTESVDAIPVIHASWVEDAYWLVHRMEEYCVGYTHIEFNGRHYYMVHHA